MGDWERATPVVSLLLRCRSGAQLAVEVRVDLVADVHGTGGIYYARPIGEQAAEGEYLADFLRVSPDLLRLEGARNGLPAAYHGCGVTRTLIPVVALRHGVRICSSRHRPHEGESRTDAATASWRHLVRDGLASYDPIEDRFYHPPL